MKKIQRLGVAVLTAVMGLGSIGNGNVGTVVASEAEVSETDVQAGESGADAGEEEGVLKFIDDRFNQEVVKRYFTEKKTIPVGGVMYVQDGDIIYPSCELVSSDPEVASIRLKNTVVMHKTGTTTISGTYNGQTVSFVLNLVDKNTETPGTITVNTQDYYLLTKGASRQIKYSTKNLTSKVTIKNSNKKVVSVSKSGKMKAKKAGKAVITLSAAGGDGKKVSTKITVKVREGTYLSSVCKKAIKMQDAYGKTNCTDKTDKQNYVFTKKIFNILNSIGDQYASVEYTQKETKKALLNCSFTYPLETPKNKASRTKKANYTHGVESGKDEIRFAKFTVKGKATAEKIYKVLQEKQMWSDYYVYTKAYYDAGKNRTEVTCIQAGTY